MKILGIDSTSKNLSICVSSNNTVLFQLNDMRSLKHMKNIITDIKKVFCNLPFTIHDIDLFAVNLGPGDFTGSRIGISVIKTFSMLSKRKALGFNALDVFAVSSLFKNIDKIKRKIAKNKKVFIAPLMDVRNQEIFFSVYEAEFLNQKIIDDGMENIFKNVGSKNISFVSKEQNILLRKVYDKNILCNKNKFQDSFYQLALQIKRLEARTCISCGGLFLNNYSAGSPNNIKSYKKSEKSGLQKNKTGAFNYILTGNAFFSYDSVFAGLMRQATEDKQIEILIEKNNKYTKAEYVNMLADFRAITRTGNRVIAPFYVRDFIPFGK